MLTPTLGYPMAKNLRAKVPEADELCVCDTNPAVTENFLSEAKAMRVQVAQSPREVAEKSVSGTTSFKILQDELLFYR
jgi:3-hydroxyisobutyrate/3-hydroxypropionate dehydrogenase